MNRPSRPGQRAALKIAFREMVEACGGTMAAAKHTRVAPAHISDYCNFDKPTQAPIDVVLDLALVCKSLGAFGELLEQIGARQTASDPTLTAGQASEVFGKLCHLTIEANADGKYSRNEARPILAVAAEADELLGKLKEPAFEAVAGA